MRWSNLTITADEQARLPGYRDEAVVRRFDAPEALETRFYEVRAKSALNRVPAASQVPFRWTINPYRGCSHACSYCLRGDTRISLAAGGTRALEDLQEGDAILGTDGNRRLVETTVVAHWATEKPAHRVTLEDGTELVASGDHRFLTTEGWRAVAPTEPGREPLTTESQVVAGAETGRLTAELRVRSIEALGAPERLYDITTGTGDFIANGVVSHNCFARPTHKYLDFDAGRDFEKEIIVKVNVPEVLRVELARPSWKGEHVALGTNTDPYQWVEGRYKLMRGIWETMRDFSNPCSILTKSPLLLRDLDLMLEIAERTSIHANLSIPTMDEKAWRASEPHTPNPKARMEAVKALNEAGIPCGILIAPLMPGINDAPDQVERILEMAADAGATGIGGIALHLRGDVKEVFMDWLRSYRPELVPRYEELYAGNRAYAPKSERERMARIVRAGRDRIEDRTGTRPGQRGGTWPTDLRNAAKDTAPPEDFEVRRVPGTRPRAATVKPEPVRGRQEALF